MQEGDNILLFHPVTSLRGKLSPGQGQGSGLGDIRKHVGRFQEADTVLPVLLSVVSMHVLTVTVPGKLCLHLTLLFDSGSWILLIAGVGLDNL